MKKILLSMLLAAALSGCKKSNQNTKSIAITQIVNHPSLNEAKRGIMEHLPKTYKVLESDAQGDVMLAQQIAQRIM